MPDSLVTEIVIGAALLMIGAAGTRILSASGQDEKIKGLDQGLNEAKARISSLENVNASGGPPPLNHRVGQLEQTIQGLNDKLDAMNATIQAKFEDLLKVILLQREE